MGIENDGCRPPGNKYLLLIEFCILQYIDAINKVNLYTYYIVF